MGLLDTDAVRAPLLPLDPDARAAMAVTLRSLGLAEAAGGRISTRVGRRPARPWHDARRSRRRRSDAAATVEALLDDLEAGRLRAAEPDPTSPDGWRVRPEVKAAILACFGDRTMATWSAGPLTFRDRAAVPPRDLADGPWRIVPGGTAVRRGAYLADGVVVMPPSYVNIGAWIGAGTMVDSHVLVGSCAQIGARVHLSAGVSIGGVLEPAGARPVIVEDEAFVGAGQRAARRRARADAARSSRPA